MAFYDAFMPTSGMSARYYPARTANRLNATRAAATARRAKSVRNARARQARLRKIVENPEEPIIGPLPRPVNNNAMQTNAAAASAVRMRAFTALRRARMNAAAAANRPVAAAAARTPAATARRAAAASAPPTNAEAAAMAHAVVLAQIRAMPAARTLAQKKKLQKLKVKEIQLRTKARRLGRVGRAMPPPLARRQAMTSASSASAARMTAAKRAINKRRKIMEKAIADLDKAGKKAMNIARVNKNIFNSNPNRANLQNKSKLSAAAAVNAQRKYNNAIVNLNMFNKKRGRPSQANRNKLTQFRQLRNNAQRRMNVISAYVPNGQAATRQKNINYAAARQARNYAVSNITALRQANSRRVTMRN
jgi:hypothetical protein